MDLGCSAKTELKLSSRQGRWRQLSECELGCLAGGPEKRKEIKQGLPCQGFVPRGAPPACFRDCLQASQRGDAAGLTPNPAFVLFGNEILLLFPCLFQQSLQVSQPLGGTGADHASPLFSSFKTLCLNVVYDLHIVILG